jgi:flagellar export protein FliJ
MAFRFPLATVLRVRESIEQREERALQRLQLEIARARRQIEELSAQIANAHLAREEALRHPIPAGHLHTMLWDAQAAVEKKKTLLHALHTLEQQRDQQMKLYQAAHRDREMLTDMQDQQLSAYQQEQSRTQQKHLDDIFIARRQRG